MPKFSQIKAIYMIKSVCFLFVNVFRTVGIDRHFNSYVIQDEDREDTFLLKDLPGHQTTTAHTLNQTLYISLHSHILKT